VLELRQPIRGVQDGKAIFALITKVIPSLKRLNGRILLLVRLSAHGKPEF
jgi:hypothetical protein